MAKPLITTYESLTALLFAKIGVYKYDEAMELFCGSSINTSGASTLKAKYYMMSEE